MIRHVVMWTLKAHAEGAGRAANAVKMKRLLDSCAGLVPGMRRWEVALAQPGLEATCDVLLVSEFDDRDALDAYQGGGRVLAARGRVRGRGGAADAHGCPDDHL